MNDEFINSWKARKVQGLCEENAASKVTKRTIDFFAFLLQQIEITNIVLFLITTTYTDQLLRLLWKVSVLCV